MTITPEDLVRREVFYCVSSLVSTLAAPAYAETLPPDLAQLCEAAFDLASPIDDWEEAAIQAGWSFNADSGYHFKQVREHGVGYDDIDPGGWRELCERENIEPYDREVYEHWIVSDWLADKLEAKGEKVDRDFAGMTVWARTTTGQAIFLDYVIEAITAELNANA